MTKGAWDNGNCQEEPTASVDDALDPEPGSLLAILFGSN